MKRILMIVIVTVFAFYMPACKSKPKDAEIKTAVESVLTSNPDYNGVVVDVTDGVATVRGEVRDAATQSSLQTAVAGVKGVKSVQNNTSIAPPPVVVTPPTITADDPLTMGVTDALKDYPSVKATVNNGVITVTGETTAANWKKIKMALDGLHPKKVDPSGLKIK
jgi:osmotically-inducible protein OsmY